ncbi:MAG: Lrp/AsnC ligand binding domain-containing protein, partial [Gammaproteobacteria bacterium]
RINPGALRLFLVKQCYFVSGDTDYFLVIHVNDMQQYNEFSRKVFANEPNIKVFRTMFCMNRIKYSTKIDLE